MRFFSFNQLPLYTDDFFFSPLKNDNRDTIVVFNPMDALIVSPVFLRSRKTLNEHIEYIQNNNIRKAKIVAEDISFLKQCPNLEYLMVFPAVTAKEFDYSPIYELKNIKWLQCQTVYGIDDEKTAVIDYSRFENLQRIGICGAYGHQNVDKAGNIISMFFDSGFPKAKTLEGVIPGKVLENFSVVLSPIQSLNGIDAASHLRRLELQYNRRLSDITALRYIKESLIFLKISNCGKIHDFSVLKELKNLKFLTLNGSNTLSDLSFLKEMPNLQNFELSMNVADGDLSLCKNIPYVRIKNRKHYLYKDSELSKNYTDPEEIVPFETLL